MKIEAEDEEGWIWGNHRGGGGAPLKDEHGNNITDLKKVINSPKSHSGGKSGNKYKYFEDEEDPIHDHSNQNGRKPRRNHAHFEEEDHVETYHEDDQNRSGKKGIRSSMKLPPRRRIDSEDEQVQDLSPRRMGGALREMNSQYNPKELELKHKYKSYNLIIS